MNAEQLQTMIRWLNEQIAYASSTINEAQQSSNYGRLAVYEGMREAYTKCLTRLTSK